MGNNDPFGRPRNPRPKGAQKDTVCRDQGGGWDAIGNAAGGCLMTLLLAPALPVLALVRRRGPNAQCGCCGCRKWMCSCSCCCGR